MGTVTHDASPDGVSRDSGPGVGGGQIELAVGGMSCASCAARIERRLNKLDGVQATVNYATEKAQVRYPAGVDTAALVAAVEQAGYTATPPHPTRTDAGRRGSRRA